MAFRLRSLIVAAGAGGVLYFAIQGGEYTTVRVLQDRAEKGRVEHDIDSLRRQVDSLTRYKHQLDTDPALQERIARESFGMVRSDKEMVYHFVKMDSARHDSTRDRPRH